MSKLQYILVYHAYDKPPFKYFAGMVRTENQCLEIYDEDGYCLAEFNATGWVHIDYVRE